MPHSNLVHAKVLALRRNKRSYSEIHSLTKVPKSQFIKVQILESRAKLTNAKSKYGICCLYFSKTEFHIKIDEWIRLLSLDLRV